MCSKLEFNVKSVVVMCMKCGHVGDSVVRCDYDGEDPNKYGLVIGEAKWGRRLHRVEKVTKHEPDVTDIIGNGNNRTIMKVEGKAVSHYCSNCGAEATDNIRVRPDFRGDLFMDTKDSIPHLRSFKPRYFWNPFWDRMNKEHAGKKVKDVINKDKILKKLHKEANERTEKWKKRNTVTRVDDPVFDGVCDEVKVLHAWMIENDIKYVKNDVIMHMAKGSSCFIVRFNGSNPKEDAFNEHDLKLYLGKLDSTFDMDDPDEIKRTLQYADGIGKGMNPKKAPDVRRWIYQNQEYWLSPKWETNRGAQKIIDHDSLDYHDWMVEFYDPEADHNVVVSWEDSEIMSEEVVFKAQRHVRMDKVAEIMDHEDWRQHVYLDALGVEPETVEDNDWLMEQEVNRPDADVEELKALLEVI